MLYSSNDDLELRNWLNYQLEHGGNFLRSLADAAKLADIAQYAILRPALVMFRAQSPEPGSMVVDITPIRAGGGTAEDASNSPEARDDGEPNLISRRKDLDEFYRILGELRERKGGCRRLGTCFSKMDWPERGIYFFFENGELREDGKTLRAVRAGTHAVAIGAISTLWQRLLTHRGGNHRSSIFRRRVGEALLPNLGLPDDVREAISISWPTKDVEREIGNAEAPLEAEVSKYICQMPFLWVKVDDAPGPQNMRVYLETNSIALLSNFRKPPTDPSSDNWLGRFSPVQKIRDSGLWNSNHVDAEYDPGFLLVLERYAILT
jgi:hypothetical protein